jgi:hypothetical protein
VFCIIPIVGIALIGGGQSGLVSVAGAALCGLGLGALVGQQALFVGRYFGLKAYGKIYGMTFALFLTGTGLGPYLGGLSFDTWHSYRPALFLFGLGLLIASVLMIPFGAYAFGTREPSRSGRAPMESLASSAASVPSR